MSAAHRTHFLCNTLPPPSHLSSNFPSRHSCSLHLQLVRTIGQCRLAKAFDTPTSVYPRPSDLNCHHILSQQLKQGGGVGGGGRELHCNCFSDWYSVPSIHTRSVARYVYAALQQQQQPKQQLSYHTEAPLPPHSCCYSCSCSSWT